MKSNEKDSKKSIGKNKIKIKETKYLFEVVPYTGWKCLKCNEICRTQNDVKEHHNECPCKYQDQAPHALRRN